MKKVLLSLLAVSALVLSCQNYDEEFDLLNSKIESLQAQITSLAELKTAVAGVQSNLSALQAAVSDAAAKAAAAAAGSASAIEAAEAASEAAAAASTAAAAASAAATSAATGSSEATAAATAAAAAANAASEAAAAASAGSAVAATNAANAATQAAAAAAAAAEAAVGSATAAESAAAAAAAAAAAQAATEAAAAANAASLAALSVSVDAIIADIAELDAAVALASTAAELEALKTELSTSIAALDALIDGNAAQIVLLLANDVSLAASISALGVDLTALIEANAADIADLIANDAAMSATLASLGVDITLILNTVYTYEGNLVINDLASLAFATNLGNKVRAIKGNVSVDINSTNYQDFTIAAVNAVTSRIQNVNGNVVLNGYNASIDVSSLVNITGDYIVTGYDAADDAVSTVGDDVYFNYDGPYNSNIAVADNIYLYTNSETTTAVGTSAISFMSLIKVAGVQTVDSSGVTVHTSGGGHTSGGSVSVSTGAVVLSSSSATNALNLTDATTSVKIAQAPITYVYGNGLETLELHYAAAATTASPALSFLTINGSALTSATVKAENISGAISVTAKSTGSTLNMNDIESVGTFTSNAATNNLTGLTSATTFTSTGVTSNDLSALASATTLNLAAASNNLSSLASATTITSSGADHNFAALATVGTLTLSGDTTPSLPALTAATGNITLAAATSLSFPELATATNITGASATGTVTFPSLTSGNTMTFASASGFTARLATVDVIDLDATEDLSIDVASFDFTDGATELPDMASIVSLTLRNQATSIASSYLAGLESATTLTINASDDTTEYTGRPGVDIVLSGSSTDYESLTTVVVTGVVDELSVSGMTALTSLTTGGAINMVTVHNNAVITDGLNFGHTDPAEFGTYLRVTSNALLETFTTSSNRPYHFVVTGNPKLESFDASSFTAMPNWYDELGDSLTPFWTLNESNFEVELNYAGTGTTTATGMIGSYVSDTASTDETFKEDSLNSLKPILTLLYNGVYVGDAPYDGWLGSGKTLTVTLKYLAPANASEVSSGQYAAGTYQLRTIDFASGEVADIAAE